ncbi:hypothetical protein F4802DRAFT_19901 [Xylaria palmicola]|nr:hypothetical protein F4802DRAFT_19901 [Xylaria palmicola]
MEVLGAIASVIAIGQAIGITPKVVKTLKAVAHASKEIEALVDELENLYAFYEHMKTNIDLFSGEQIPPLLRVNEPPYLQLIRRDFESLTVALQGLADWCLIDDGASLKVSKLRWWRKRKDIARLREDCNKQRQRLQDFYCVFRDRFAHKQGEVLVHIHTHISEGEGRSPHDSSALPSLGDHTSTPSSPVEERFSTTKSDATSLIPSNKGATETAGQQCRCPCHTRETSTQNYYGRRVRLYGGGFLIYRSQMTRGNQCTMSCCIATKSFAMLQFRVPIPLLGLARTGSFTFQWPLNINISFTTTIQFYTRSSSLQFLRVCYLGKPEYLNKWLSHYGLSILSVDERGDSMLDLIIRYGGSSLLTYCITTWPRLIKEASCAREAVHEAKLFLGSRDQISISDKFHLTKFIQFMDIEDDDDDMLEIVFTDNPIHKLDQVLLNKPQILTKRDVNGKTLLHYACIADDVELVEHLLRFEGLLNATDNNGSTPLHVAIQEYAWSSAELLVEKGCQINVIDDRGDPPLWDTIKKIGFQTTRAIQFAKSLLLKGADAGLIAAGRCVWRKFHHCVSHREDLWELYEMILSSGGAQHVNIVSHNYRAPLVQALCVPNAPLALFLRKAGARLDILDHNEWNILHYVALFGDERSCHLAAQLEISCIDIRTTDNIGVTPLAVFRALIKTYSLAAGDFIGYPKILSWPEGYQDNPGEARVSQSKSIAFEHLLRSVRDRMLLHEIETLELILSEIRAPDLLSARGRLRELVEGKVKAKIDHEAETFRAIEMYIRGGSLELAIESIEEFIEVSRERMQVSPFDEEIDCWEDSDSESEGSDVGSEKTERCDEDDDEQGCSEGDERNEDDEGEDAKSEDGKDEEEDGWETAEEG